MFFSAIEFCIRRIHVKAHVTYEQMPADPALAVSKRVSELIVNAFFYRRCVTFYFIVCNAYGCASAHKGIQIWDSLTQYGRAIIRLDTCTLVCGNRIRK